MASPKILVVESDLSVAQEIEEQLEVLGYPVCASVQRGVQAIKTIPEVRPDLVLVDIELEGELKGDEVAEEIYGRFNIPVVYLMDSDEADLLEGVKMSRVFGHVFKPFNLNQLHLSIEHCLYYHEKSLEYTELEAQLNQTISELHSRTQLMETVFDSMAEGIIVADTAGNLLLSNQGAAQVFNVEVLTPDLVPSTWAKEGGLFEVDKETYLSTDRNPLLRARQGKPTDDMEVFVCNRFCPDGIYLNVNGRPLLNADNEVTAGIVIFRDMTEDKQAATALAQKVNELHNQTQRLETAEVELKQTVQELQEQQQLMETIFNSVSDGIVVTNEAGAFLFVNPSAERIVGMGETDTTPDEWSEIYGTFYPDKVTPFPSEELPLVHAMQGKMTDGVDLFIRNQGNPDGVFINVSGRSLRGEQGSVRGGVIVFRDVTTIKNTEAALEQTVRELRDQTQLMDTIFNSISDGVVVADEQGQFIKSNPAAEQMTGQHLEELELDRAAEQYGVFHPTQESLFPLEDLPLVRAVNGESTDNVEMRLKNPALSEDIYLSVNGRPLLDEAGALRGGVAVARDVTELKRTERELKATITQLEDQTQLMDTIFNSISDGVVVANTEGKYFMFNEAAKRMTGQNMQPIAMKDIVKQIGFFLPDQKTPLPDDQLPIARVLRGEIVDNFEMFLYNPATMQKGIHLIASARPLYDAQGILTGGVSVSRDVTELKQKENQLRESVVQLEHQGQLMQSTFDSISDGVVVADEDGQFTMFNPSAEKILGIGATDIDSDEWSEQYGVFFPDKVTPLPSAELPLTLALKGQATDNVEMFIRNSNVPDGVYISVNGRPLQSESGIEGGVVVFRDVTERILAEEAKLAQAFAQGRLEIVEILLHNIGNSVNSVTVGVKVLHDNLANNRLVHRFSRFADMIKAHQGDWEDYIKNDPKGQQVLPFILALAEDFTAQNEQLVQTLERVRDRVSHIVDIIRTQRSSNQSGMTDMTEKNIHLQEAILNALKLQQDSLDKREIQIEIDCEKAPQEIHIQESQFHQMLVNLFKNSIEAIDELMQSAGLSEAPHIKVKAYISGDFLHLDVTDNGIGIEKEHFNRIFSTGYTTKKSGTGLGLHSIANFVIGSGGEIYPLSEGIGKGTTMRIKLLCSSVIPSSPAPGAGTG